MGRQSLRSPFPIAVRTSSINAETVHYDDKSPPKKTSQGTLRMGSGRNKTPTSQQPDPSFRELRVRASSPLLGRSYRAHQSPPVPEVPQLHKSESIGDLGHNDHSFEKYAFDTQSQRSLAYGVVEDMRGIGFPHLEKGSKMARITGAHPTTPPTVNNPPPKRKPSRLDLSLLFPKPKPAPAPLLSPQRYTNSPSPVASDYSVRPPPNRLSKPRSKSNVRASVNAPIPEEPLPPIRRVSQKPMDWFDVPLEKIIRLEKSGEEEEEEEEEELQEEDEIPKPPPRSELRAQKVTKANRPPAPSLTAETNSIVTSSVVGSERTGSERFSFTPSMVSHRTSRDSRISGYNLNRQHIPPPSLSRMPGSLHAWQSEGDLRSSQKRTGLKKKKSSSTFMTLDLTKTSVLSLSSSESESEGEDFNTDEDSDEGERILSRAAPSHSQAGLRDSFSTNDYFEPEICRAEAVVAKSYGFTRLDRANSNVSSVSSGSRNTARRPIRSRPESFSSAGKSSVSVKMLGSPGQFNVPLIEEPEEHTDQAATMRRPQQRPLRTNSDIHSAKRRSRIIAVTRQEETILEAMRERNGRITPSIFKGIEGPAAANSGADTKPPSVPAPKVRSPEAIQTEFDTSFLRLSTAMRLSMNLGSPAAGENASSSREKDTCTSLGSGSDSSEQQKNDGSISNNYTASPRLSLAYSETPSSTSTIGHASPVTPTLPIYRVSPRAPPPPHAPPPLPEDAVRRHSRRRTDSSEAIVLGEADSSKAVEAPYPLWAVKWGRDPNDLAFVH